MREVSLIAQEFYNQVLGAPQIAKVQFVTHYTEKDLERVTRTPLLLINPHLMYESYPRHRQRGTQLFIATALITRDQRGERDWSAALDIMETLDALDAKIVNSTLGLEIQPFVIYQRQSIGVEKGWSVVRTVYATVIYNDLAASKFVYHDCTGVLQAVEFPLISTSFQTEKVTDNNDYGRVLDGSLRVYNRSPKRRYDLRFTLINTALKEQLRTLKEARTEITFYRSKDAAPTMACYWVNDFDFFEEQPGRWTGTIVLAES